MKFRRVIFRERIVAPNKNFEEVVTAGSPEYSGAGQEQVDAVLEDRRGVIVVIGEEAVLVPWGMVKQANGKAAELSTALPARLGPAEREAADRRAQEEFDARYPPLPPPKPMVDPPVLPPGPLEDQRHRRGHGARRGS